MLFRSDRDWCIARPSQGANRPLTWLLVIASERWRASVQGVDSYPTQLRFEPDPERREEVPYAEVERFATELARAIAREDIAAQLDPEPPPCETVKDRAAA